MWKFLTTLAFGWEGNFLLISREISRFLGRSSGQIHPILFGQDLSDFHLLSRTIKTYFVVARLKVRVLERLISNFV